MQLTRAGEYGISCLLYLAKQEPGKVCLLQDICKDQSAPRFLSAKVLQGLVKSGIVRSTRGAGGGYSLARAAEEITLLEVVESIEGPICLNYCLKGAGECEKDTSCPFHPVWHEAQQKLREVLAAQNFRDLARWTPANK